MLGKAAISMTNYLIRKERNNIISRGEGQIVSAISTGEKFRSSLMLAKISQVQTHEKMFNGHKKWGSSYIFSELLGCPSPWNS
uniref:Uncharacterized protein n=1 Tax=Kalanchoe fedtschenkoi TaxID=63787 RepID=A0A7N0V531_KALFE